MSVRELRVVAQEPMLFSETGDQWIFHFPAYTPRAR